MSDFVRDALKKIAIVAAFVCCIIMGAVLVAQAVKLGKLAHDYGVFWRTANEPLSQAYVLRNFQPFPYPPPMMLWIAPLAFVPKVTGYLIVVAASLAAFWLACRPYLSKLAFALVLVSAPMVRCLRNGQLSAILAALLIWACGTANRIAAGVALGVIASIKPQLVFMAPLMLVLNRDWRAFFAAGGTFAAALVLSLLFFGVDSWAAWYDSMPHFHRIIVETNIDSIGASPAVVAERYSLPALPFMVAGGMLGGLLVYWCRNAEPLEKATAIGAASLLVSPYSLAYDLVVIVPFMAAKVIQGRILGFVAVAALFNPMPLLLAGYELVRGKFQFRPITLGGVNART